MTGDTRAEDTVTRAAVDGQHKTQCSGGFTLPHCFAWPFPPTLTDLFPIYYGFWFCFYEFPVILCMQMPLSQSLYVHMCFLYFFLDLFSCVFALLYSDLHVFLLSYFIYYFRCLYFRCILM